jgi:hypothetical protein
VASKINKLTLLTDQERTRYVLEQQEQANKASQNKDQMAKATQPSPGTSAHVGTEEEALRVYQYDWGNQHTILPPLEQYVPEANPGSLREAMELKFATLLTMQEIQPHGEAPPPQTAHYHIQLIVPLSRPTQAQDNPFTQIAIRLIQSGSLLNALQLLAEFR